MTDPQHPEIIPPADTSHKPKSSARLCAARAVQNVMRDQKQLETALSEQSDYRRLDPRDRAFARLISATVFRRMGQIDAALKPFVRKTPAPLPDAVLRTGAAQLLFLDTPPHAAISESVDLMKESVKTRAFSGMVNAVLRRVSEKGPALSAAVPPSANVPGWIRAAWEKAYGKPAARRMAGQLSAEPPLDIHVKSDAPAWAERLGGEMLTDWMVRLPKSGQIPSLPGFADGQWWVQDVAASLPVQVLARHIGSLSGLTALDMCAAPGGKTLQLAALGAQVTALDKSEERLGRVNENLARTGLTAEVICADAFRWIEASDRQFDIVVLDAPCSATGTYRRHPDVLYNRAPKDVGALVRIQKALLARAAGAVKPGGYVLYCSCSLQPEEGEGQAQHVNAHYEMLKPVNLTGADIPGFSEAFTENGYIRALPHLRGELGGMDGFFAALWRRQKEL